MPRQAKYALLLLAVVLAVAVWLLWLRGEDAWSGGLKWGQGPLKVSEREYYMNRIGAIIDTARRLGPQARLSAESQAGDSAFVYLVMDTANKEIWIESNGRVLQDYHMDLAPSTDWTLYRSTPDGTTRLPPLGRFRLPASHIRGSFLPELVSLVGTRGKQETLYFSFGSNNGSNDYVAGPWNVQRIAWPSSLEQATQERPESIIVSDADYEKAKAQFGSGPAPVEPAELIEGKAAWARAEKLLYQEIERRVSKKGLRSLLRGGLASGQAWLKIDYLGNDVWYARSARAPQHPTPIRPYLELEFLLSATGKIPRKNIATLLEEGRRRQKENTAPASKWRADLSNGVAVEFIGLGRNPSGGNSWWGPDGSPLDYSMLSANYEPYGSLARDRAMYEIAWRIHTPPGKGSGIRVSPEGNSGSYYRQVLDRYANPLPGGLEASGYALDKSRTKTTLKIGVQGNNGEFAWTTFRNISLVRGENQGFEIVEGKGEE